MTTNLITQPEAIDNAYWSKSGVTISANTANDGLGNATLDKLAETNANSLHQIYSTSAFTLTNGLPYTVSFEVRSAERTLLQIILGAAGSNVGAYFDVSAGTVTQTDSGSTTQVISLGGGLYRCCVTRTAGASALYAGVLLVSTGTTTSYTGTTGSGLYIGRAKLEQAAAFTSYP